MVVLGSAKETCVSEMIPCAETGRTSRRRLARSWWKGASKISLYFSVSCMCPSCPIRSRYDEKSKQVSKDPGDLTCCTGWTRGSVEARGFFVRENC